MSRKLVLVVDDEKDIVKLLEYNLRKEGYEVVTAGTGEDGLKAALSSRRPDLVVLDLMLPRIDGLEVCRLLRADGRTRSLPVLMLTAKGTDTDQIVGLAMGADDYVTKPFNIQVLCARVKKLLQRHEPAIADAPGRLSCGDLEIDPSRQKVLLKGREIALTSLQFRILHFLARQPGKVFTRNQVLDGAWKHEAFVVDRTVDVHVKSIRKKLGKSARLIETVRGEGYRFRESA